MKLISRGKTEIREYDDDGDKLIQVYYASYDTSHDTKCWKILYFNDELVGYNEVNSKLVIYDDLSDEALCYCLLASNYTDIEYQLRNIPIVFWSIARLFKEGYTVYAD